MTEPLLQVDDVAKRYGATVALDGVNLAVRAGEVHALIGENGAGKSTLMNVLAGAVRPDRGALSLGGRPYAPASPSAARRSGVALIHQELSLCPHLTVTENIVLGAERAHGGWVDRRANRAVAEELLAQFDRPDIDPDRRVSELPLASRQVVEICRALTADPESGSGRGARVLLMDEPTSSFQRADTERLFALVRRLAARGMAVIYISHFLEEVREIADGYTVLRDGRSVDAGRIADVPNEHLVARMVGRSMEGMFPSREGRTAGDVLLSVRGLAAPPAVRHASFDVRAGEILGVAGLIGAGRTELVRALFGLDAATAGTVTVRGRATPARAHAADRLAAGLGYLSEDRKGEGLALPLSIADNLTATRPPRGWAGLLDLGRQRAQARKWMEVLRVRARAPSQPVRALSGGNQQKVALGRLLHQDADVLLLDEPTRGIDVGSKAQVYEAVARAAAEGKGVLVVSSYLPELFGLCDRLAVMRRGRLSAARPIEEWTPETVLAEAIGGVDEDQRPTDDIRSDDV